jgi:hypothetical protein
VESQAPESNLQAYGGCDTSVHPMAGSSGAAVFATNKGHPSTEMWPRLWKPLLFVVAPAAIVLAILYVIYRFIDPIPPRHFVIAAGMAGSGYDNFARQYARILARDGVEV